MRPTVIIVTRDGGPRLHRCVDALRSQRAARILVVVSASAPVDVPSGITRCDLGANLGYARAANAGLRQVSAGPAILLNDDTVPAPGFIAALRTAARRQGEGIYQPAILLADGTDRVENTGHHLFPDGFNMAWGRGQPASAIAHRGPEAGSFSGAAVMLTERVRADVGLFDEDLEAFGEDTDLSLRALRRGYRVHLVPDARVRHELGGSYGRNGARKVYLVERNRVLLAIRNLPLSAVLAMPAWTGLRLSLLLTASLSGRGPGAGVGPRGAAAAAQGVVAGLAGAPGAWRKRQHDRPAWVVDDPQVWRHLRRHRVRLDDLLGGV